MAYEKRNTRRDSGYVIASSGGKKMSEYVIKVYEKNWERETIRDLSYAQMFTIREVFMRHNVKFKLFRRTSMLRLQEEYEQKVKKDLEESGEKNVSTKR